MIALRKELWINEKQRPLFQTFRYFFYITNIEDLPAPEVVLFCNGRCNQENLIEQLKNGLNALRMPVGDLASNWAYMVMASLAWTLKAWTALVLPVSGRWKQKHESEKRSVLRMEFRTFLNAFMRVPCQILRQGRRLIYRLLSWNPWQRVFLRAVEAVRILRC